MIAMSKKKSEIKGHVIPLWTVLVAMHKRVKIISSDWISFVYLQNLQFGFSQFSIEVVLRYIETRTHAFGYFLLKKISMLM